MVMKKPSNLYTCDVDYKEQQSNGTLGSNIKTPTLCISCLPFYPKSRLTVASSHLTYITTLLLSILLLILVIVIIIQSLVDTTSNQDVPSKYIPMVQFNRGDVDKEEVVKNARSSLQKLDEFRQKSDDTTQDLKSIYNKVIETLDKKEKRQFLALEALDINDISDFEALIELGYETKSDAGSSELPNYKAWSKTIRLVSPNYDNLCYKTAFTLSNRKMQIDDGLCSRLKMLEKDIREGRELPLLTIFTWWPDQITDTEVLSKKAVMANWDIFRPFIIPVVLTNHRMNMAVANGHGWPCLQTDYENNDKLPVFKNIVTAMEKTFQSTFYGYAMANSMFDSSLLQTLLNIKDRFVHEIGVSTPSPDNPLFIYGKPINTPAAGADTYEKIESFHKILDKIVGKNESEVLSDVLTYVIFRGINLTKDSPVVVDDKYLIPYLLQKHSKDDRNAVFIDTSETILSAKTQMTHSINEWGRRYLSPGKRDLNYNKNFLERLQSPSDDQDTSIRSGVKARHFKTLYDDKNRTRVMEINKPYYN